MSFFDIARRCFVAVPGVRRFERSRWGQALRYRLALHFENRKSFTFTQFLRLPRQYDALVGPVLTYAGGANRSEPLRIVVIGCSTGVEAYSISSMLLLRHPGLAVSIDAFDIDPTVIEVAKNATYDPAWVLGNSLITPEFVAATFEELAGRFVVKPQVAQRVRFDTCDILDSGSARQIPAADVVFAQNMLCNMRRPAARRAFQNICSLLAPRSVLFIDGMDLDMRSRLTRAHALQPLDFEIEHIHREARVIRGLRYPWFATGLEPWSAGRRDHVRRYSTVFLRDTG